MAADDAVGVAVVGVLPAAGKGSRLGHLPCSKEILPLAAAQDRHGAPRVYVLSDCLLAEFQRAGIGHIAVATAPHKQDIAAYFNNSARHSAAFSYVYLASPNTPASVLAALEDYPGSCAALGFPDILYGRDDAYSKLLHELDQSGADLVLGLYPTEHPHLVDMVRCDVDGRVSGLRIKPDQPPAEYTHCWLSAVWQPSFTAFMQDSMAAETEAAAADGRELYVGDLITAALGAGLDVRAVVVTDTPCLDAGTPATYAEALQHGASIFAA